MFLEVCKFLKLSPGEVVLNLSCVWETLSSFKATDPLAPFQNSWVRIFTNGVWLTVALKEFHKRFWFVARVTRPFSRVIMLHLDGLLSFLGGTTTWSLQWSFPKDYQLAWLIPFLNLAFKKIIFIYYIDLRGRGKEGEMSICFSHLFMHSLVDSCVCPDWRSDPRPWHIGTML